MTNTLHPQAQAEWRHWLRRYHKNEKEIWVTLYKKSSGKQTVTFQNLLDEALCFGWIDSMEKGIDKETYMVRFTPRKKNSQWSAMNKKRYAELLKLKLITRAGKKVYENQ